MYFIDFFWNIIGSVRACGSQIFLEMMWRNDLKHSYRSIHSNGIIVSDFISEIPPVEIVVKRYCEGTDKHSFYDILENENIVVPNGNGEYVSGPYVRFDWRNPNHVSPNTRKSVNKSPYYYVYEQAVGKEEFFTKILTNKQYAIPVRRCVAYLTIYVKHGLKGILKSRYRYSTSTDLTDITMGTSQTEQTLMQQFVTRDVRD